MKFNLFLVLAISTVLFSCKSGNKKNESKSDSIVQEATVKQTEFDLVAYSDQILVTLKDKNFEKFVEYVHPTIGVRFSASIYVETAKDKILQKSKILELAKNNKDFTWGIHEAIGDPIVLNINKYFEQYVYDVDFLKEAQKRMNQTLNPSANVSNIDKVYPNSDFVEYYFAGSNKEFEGLDYKILTLIYKKENNNYYLIGITHAQWTP